MRSRRIRIFAVSSMVRRIEFGRGVEGAAPYNAKSSLKPLGVQAALVLYEALGVAAAAAEVFAGGAALPAGGDGLGSGGI